MTAPVTLRLTFSDPHRAWQDLIGPASRSEGRVFVPHDHVLDAGTAVVLAVEVKELAEVQVEASVERSRRPSTRFRRGLWLRLSREAVAGLRSALGPGELREPSQGRAERRFDLTWTVSFRTPALMKPLATRDLSADGMHVPMPERVSPGHILEFTLHTPQGHELRLAGEVQWTSELTDAVGIRFLFEEGESRDLLRALLVNAAGGEPPAAGEGLLVVGERAEDDALVRALSQHFPDVVWQVRPADALGEVRRSRPRAIWLPGGEAGCNLSESLRMDAELRTIRQLGREPPEGQPVPQADQLFPAQVTVDQIAAAVAVLVRGG